MTRSWPLALVLVAGCSSGPIEPLRSTDLATKEIELTASIRSNGSLAQVFVTPTKGEGGYPITLTQSDALFVSVGGGPDQDLVSFEAEYVGQIDTDAVDFAIIFAHSGARFASKVTLPPPLALAGPAAPASRSQPIPITWDAGVGAYTTSLSITAPCLTQMITRNLSPETPDPGVYSVQPADLFISTAMDACDFKVELTRSITGTMAPELHPMSGASASQIRVVTIATVP